MSPQKYPTVSQEGDLFLWETGKYADVRITCRGHSMLLHRGILSRCPWFRERLDNMFNIWQENNIYEIKLDQFSPSSLQTLLSFIYSTALLGTSRRIGKFSLTYLQRSIMKLFSPLRSSIMKSWPRYMAWEIYSTSPSSQTAVLNVGIQFLNSGIQYFRRNPQSRVPTRQIDQLLEGIRIAYAGDAQKQSTLRGLYVHFFTECFENVQNNPYFFSAIRSVPIFSVDLMENVGGKNAGRQRVEFTIYTATALTPTSAEAMKAWEQM
ncbi:hypothetical protein PG994_009592 [Apiospora phragmitis]|uniref:BTB domain-containing protein n=1 Tax=Apiospora phragmitis TaxID=2905665 RepID=A0ABR1U6I1_9PEZI